MDRRLKLSTGLSGAAGEYFVAAKLTHRGYIKSITHWNTRCFNIYASNADVTRKVNIQEKTNQDSSREFVVSAKVANEEQLAKKMNILSAGIF